MYIVYLNTDLDNKKPRGTASPFRNVFDIMTRYELTTKDIENAKTFANDESIELGCYRICKAVEIDGERKELWIDICAVTPAQELSFYKYLLPQPIALEDAYKQATEKESYL